MPEVKACRLIKRYDNRKLYDTEEKRYISLRGIATLIRGGQEVVVLDNVTGNDITAQTLAKIIIDEGSRNLPLLQADSLHELVRWGGKVMTGGAQQLSHSLDRVLEGSLKRLGFGSNTREDVVRLRRKLEELESQVRRLDSEVSHEHNDDGTNA
ncbi:MAG: polyhydroxyalkanoate synthesis regulator DNA-binding domain-containing protein [Acidobacteriota bacterium]